MAGALEYFLKLEVHAQFIVLCQTVLTAVALPTMPLISEASLLHFLQSKMLKGEPIKCSSVITKMFYLGIYLVIIAWPIYIIRGRGERLVLKFLLFEIVRFVVLCIHKCSYVPALWKVLCILYLSTY